jgi:hypothetical protein
MKLYHLSLCLLFVSGSIISVAQPNSGMPLVKDVCYPLLTIYESSDNGSYFKFEKKNAGWFVYLYNINTSSQDSAQLFWDKRCQRYLDLEYPHRYHPDSVKVSEEMTRYDQRYYLTKRDIIYYDRNLYYGYSGWQKDVIHDLETRSILPDSLLECLANAYGNSANDYYLGRNVKEEDPDRRPIADSIPIPLSRVTKYISVAQKSVATYQKLYTQNSHYQCADYDIRWRMNSEAMTAWDVLHMFGFDNLRASFLKAVTFPDSVLQKARQLLDHVKPQGILFTNGDTTLYPILYLQFMGLRQDVVVLDNTMLCLKRNLANLDQKFHHTLFTTRRSVYMDAVFEAAFLQPNYEDAEKQQADSFIITLYRSPDAKDLPQIDSSLGRLYRYFTRKIYWEIDGRKASNFFPAEKVAERISLSIPGTYLSCGDVLQLDIIRKNLLSRHIYFTNITEQPMFAPYCVKRGSGIWEFVPLPIE